MNKEGQDNRSGLSIGSLVTGILSIATGLLSIVSVAIGGALGVAGIVLGAIDLKRIKDGRSSEKGRGFDIAGIICGAFGIVVSIVITILIIFIGVPWLISTFG